MTREHGSSGIQTAALAPVLIVLLLMFVGAARYGKANASVEAAAAAAARSASIARTTSAAQSTAQSAATQTLSQQGLHCAHLSTSIDTTAISKTAGTPGTIAVTITCTVSVADLGLPGATTRTFTARAISSVDTYQEAP